MTNTTGDVRPMRPRARNVALLIFLTMSLFVSMSISQEETPEVGSLIYWLLIALAGLLPLIQLRALLKTLVGRALPLLLFGMIAGAWHLLRGDTTIVLQLALVVWMLSWLSTDQAQIEVKDLVRIYLGLIIIGFGIWMMTDLNKWGPIPGATDANYGMSRVSFFRNIANTAMLSLAMTMVLTRSVKIIKTHFVVLCVALYYLIFSFVRTAQIAFVLYIALRWWFGRRYRSERHLFWISLLVGIGINLLIAFSVDVLTVFQDNEIISLFFLRQETGMTSEEILKQMYRPWLWVQQVTLFASSPALMGMGLFDFDDLQIEGLDGGGSFGDTVSLPTRLLSVYGLPTFFFIFYLIARLYRSAHQRDLWACACFPPFLVLIMQWGSIFHPTDAIGAIFFMIAVNGSYAFKWDSSRHLLH